MGRGPLGSSVLLVALIGEWSEAEAEEMLTFVRRLLGRSGAPDDMKGGVPLDDSSCLFGPTSYSSPVTLESSARVGFIPIFTNSITD